MSRFPTIAHHGAPLACFYCGASLETAAPQDYELPDGHGRYRKACDACGFRTYYDLAPRTVAALLTLEGAQLTEAEREALAYFNTINASTKETDPL